MLYDLFPSMPAARLFPLAERFAPILANFPWFADVFGVGGI
jgi:hypothetical protein